MDPLTRRWCNGTGGHTRGAKAWLRDGVERRKAIALGYLEAKRLCSSSLQACNWRNTGWLQRRPRRSKAPAGWWRVILTGASAGAETGKEDWPNGCDGDSFWSEHADDLCVCVSDHVAGVHKDACCVADVAGGCAGESAERCRADGGAFCTNWLRKTTPRPDCCVR